MGKRNRFDWKLPVTTLAMVVGAGANDLVLLLNLDLRWATLATAISLVVVRQLGVMTPSKRERALEGKV